MISVLYNNGKQQIYLDEIVTSVTWSGDIMQASRKLEVDLSNTVNGRTRAIDIEQGKEIRFFNGKKELFRGVIFADDINARGQHRLVAYDENIYLTRNKDTRIFKNMTASQIVKRLCNDFRIKMGKIDDTKYVIPKLILRDKTLWEMMIIALTVTQKSTGRRFFICSKEGKLQLLARKEQTVQWVLENGVNIIDANYSQNIEELRNQVKVIGGDEKKAPVIATVKNDKLIKSFGLMQHLENVDSKMKKSQMEQLAKQLLKELGTIDDEASLECLGIDDVIAGTGVYVKESMTHIIGGYYVSTDSHRFSQGSYTMSLNLSATDELPKMEYEEESK
ncbi:hypothetical protein ACLM5H_04910 [Fredinandcohnia humi]